MTGTAVPVGPPRGHAPVVVELDGAGHPALALEATAPGSVAGAPVSAAPLRDVLLDVSLHLDHGDEDDLFGVYLRQAAPDRYLACGVSVGGRTGIVALDGGRREVLLQGPLAPDLPFNPGFGARNRCTVLACGPSITFLLNGAVVAGVAVDPRYAEGHAGLVVARGAAGWDDARLVADWVQVRGILPDPG